MIFRVDPRWGDRGGPRVVESVVLRDPDRRIPWTIVCDPAHGSRLPDLSFNAMPAPPPACGGDPAARILTGFDLDPESLVRAPDGTFWISEEFGPFLVHVAADGRLLEPPVQVPGVRSPQNPFLDLADRARPERPTVAASRGFEGMAISPDGGTLYALLEGAVAGDDAQDLRIYVYRVAERAFADAFLRLRLEMPSQTVNLATLTDSRGAPGVPGRGGAARRPGVDRRAEGGQRPPAPRDRARQPRRRRARARASRRCSCSTPRGRPRTAATSPRRCSSTCSPSPTPTASAATATSSASRSTPSSRCTWWTTRTLLVASDNNFPGSNGRARSRSLDRSGPLAADDTELVLVRLGTPLGVDRRLLPPADNPDARSAPRDIKFTVIARSLAEGEATKQSLAITTRLLPPAATSLQLETGLPRIASGGPGASQ